MNRTFNAFQRTGEITDIPDVEKDFCDFGVKETTGSVDGFSDAVTVWINKPHVVNRRLRGAKVLKYWQYSCLCDNERKIGWRFAVKAVLSDEISKQPHNEECKACIEVPSLSMVDEGKGMIIVRDLYPKYTDRHPVTREIICYDANRKSAWFFPVTDTFSEVNEEEKVTASSSHSYQLLYQEEQGISRILLRVSKDDKEADPDSGQTRPEKAKTECEWLRDNLLTKIANWSKTSNLKTTVTSLRLVQIDQYNTLYSHLREKYGKRFVEIWPEKTDPQKFVYEDVAIATYLLILWEQERKEKGLDQKQSFVDLGCGNGLLVHILSAEGHPGLGLDIRKRHIWDIYGPETNLREQTIIPSFDCLFPQYDWLIGNHSDELTPWIPVMAARSSFTCRYFVLPCCPFDFDCKFSQKVSGQSNYRGYLDWVTEVGVICGFDVEEDTLRIPSTKRVCFIGKNRTYNKADESAMDEKRTAYIKTRCKPKTTDVSKGDKCPSATDEDGESSVASKRPKLDCEHTSESQQWTSNFQPRESIEKSRNCKNVKKEIKELIINTVFTRVLQADTAEVRELSDGRIWHKGGSLPLSDVVAMFDRDVLLELKSECGGIQTLLRNHNMIFNVSGGKVQLRDLTMDKPFSKRSKLSSEEKKQHFKTMLCWFHRNHPDGCPRSADTCTFAHGDSDLQPLKK